MSSATQGFLASPDRAPSQRSNWRSFRRDGRHFNVSVRDWSDTTTFLLEAEVVRRMTGDTLRRILSSNFRTRCELQPARGGAGTRASKRKSMEKALFFPLDQISSYDGPIATVGVDRDQSETYRCKLKPGYQFR